MWKGKKNEVKWEKMIYFEVKWIILGDFLMQLVYLIYFSSVEIKKLYYGYIFEVNFMITKSLW